MQRSLGKWIRNLTLGLIALTFALFFGPQSQFGSLDSIGSVYGEELNPTIYNFLRQSRREQEQQLRDQRIPRPTIDQLISGQVLNEMAQRSLMAHEARRMGLLVSDAELRDSICSNPIFLRDDGRCDPNLFRSALQANRYPPERDYIEFERENLLIAKLRRYVAEPVRVSTATARARLAHDQTTLSLRYVRIPKASADPESQPDAEALRNFIASSPEQIEQEYERRRAEFQRPEQARARQILLTGEDAEQRAKQAIERLEAGEDFPALAGELSQDPGTSATGGDLGFFPRGRLDPALDAAVFAAEPGSVVGPIQTDRGYHVLRVEERRAAIDRSLDDVREELAKELLQRQRASEAARQRALELIQAAAQPGASLASAAEDLGLEVEATPPYASPAQRIPGLPPLPNLRELALGLSEEAPLIPEPFDAGDAVYVVALLERKTPSAEEIDRQLESARARLSQVDQGQVLEQVFQDARKRAEAANAIKLYPSAVQR